MAQRLPSIHRFARRPHLRVISGRGKTRWLPSRQVYFLLGLCIGLGFAYVGYHFVMPAMAAR